MMLERRKSSGGFSTAGSSTGGGSASADDALAEALAEFAVEEEQVLKGVELIYSDKLNEAEEFFETLRSGHARFNLHYAEVAVVVALMSYDQDDIGRATVLLTETEVLAAQQAQKWKSHTNLQKVNEAVTNIKKWAIGNTKKMGQAIGATALVQAVGGAASAVQAVAGVPPVPKTVAEAEEEAEEAPGTPHSKEELKWMHRSRRARLWALQFQAECYLMNSLLQIVGTGEKWSSMMKLGYNLQRTWSIYKHCQSKLRQLYKQWVELEGTFGLPNQQDAAAPQGKDGEGAKAPPLLARPLEHSVSLPPRSAPPSYEESSKALKWNQKAEPAATITATTSGPTAAATDELEVIDETKGVKEDKELSCLRLGVEFGSGAFNLLVSLIPSTYQKAVEVMGAPADRGRGLSLLQKVARSKHARAPLASLFILHYHTVIRGLFPYSPEQSRSAESVLASLPPAVSSGSVYRVMRSRLARYEGAVRKALEIVEPAASNLEGLAWQGNNSRLKHVMLDELGWSLLLQADFPKAAECFGRLHQDSVWFKPFYAYLQAACLWEAPVSFHDQAAALLRDLPGMASAKSVTLEPLEQLGLSVATAFVATNQAPLFPALELAAYYNGFQQMEKPALERHRQHLEDCLRSSRLGSRGSDFVDEFKLNAAGELVGVVSATQPATSSSKGAASKAAPQSHFEHKWTKSSKLKCRHLLALCQLNLGEKQAAQDNFRYVIAATEVVPENVVPYSCYELGSLMLQGDEKSEEGFELLDRVSSYPPHEFQSRLKFIVTETIKMYGGTSKEEAADPDIPPTPALEKKKSTIFSKAVNLGHLGNLSNLGNLGNLGNLSNLGNLGPLGNINPFAKKGGEG